MTRPGIERVRGVYVLIDDDPRWRHDVRAQLEGALSGGASVIQLRSTERFSGLAVMS